MSRAILLLAALLALSCAGAVETDPRPSDDCDAFCGRLVPRVCSPHLDHDGCVETCEADHSGQPCWPAVLAWSECIAAQPDEQCVDQSSVCLDERAEFESCYGK